MTDWRETLYRELDEWNYAGVAATLWWRDDDAQSPTGALDKLLGLAHRHDAPVALAVIPSGMDDALASHVASSAMVTVLQHGYSHANHAPASEKKNELGNHRELAVIQRELAAGFTALKAAFGPQFLPVLTPPWNRMARSVPDGLRQLGFAGLSAFGPRPAREPAAGIRAVNTHVDLIDWKNAKRFAGAHRTVDALVAHLRGRRLGDFDADEPTGLLTHHLVHDSACRQFLEQLLAALDEHPAARWQTAGSAFGLGPPGP